MASQLLFQRADGSPMQFYLTNLTDEFLRNLTDLIENNGGKVEKTMNEDEYLTFTVPWECYTYRFVFDVLFIQNCVKYNTLLDIGQYYIGDSRLKTQKDRMFRLLMGNSAIVKEENLSSNEALSDITNLPTKSPTKSPTSICSQEVLIVLKRLEPSKLKNPLSSVKGIATHRIKTEPIKSEIKIKDTSYEPSNSQSTLNRRFTDEEYLSNVSGSSDTERQDSDVDMNEEYSDPQPSTSTARNSLKQNTTNIIEQSDTELETSDVDNIEERVKDELWISTKKLKSENNSSSDDDLDAEPRNARVKRASKKKEFIVEPTGELIQWAQEITKNMEKDEFGHPKGNSQEYEKWEKDVMIAFIVRIGGYDSCKGPNLWQLACNLKILPKRRTYSSLLYEFRTHILANIEDFHLPPEIEAIFIKIKPLINSKVQRASEDLKAWAKKVTENKKKDEFGYPIGKPHYTWEYKMMIDFLIESGLIKETCSLTTWEFACSLKIFPRCRAPRALQKIFRTQVLMEIEKYNLPKEIEEQFFKLQPDPSRTTVEPSAELKAWAEKMKKPATNRKKGKHFKEWNKRLMVEYLIKTDQIENYRSLATWKCFKQLKLCPEKMTCNYLLWKFRNEVLPTIEHFDLSKDILERFTKTLIHKSYTDIEITEEVKKWAVEVSKGRRKDKFGYPIELEINIQPWEKILMIEFVRKIGRFDLSKAPNFWKLAIDLKFLPKKRTMFTLASHYRCAILPYIENYKLPPEEEAKFISSRTAADVKICNNIGKNGKKGPKHNKLDISIS